MSRRLLDLPAESQDIRYGVNAYDDNDSNEKYTGIRAKLKRERSCERPLRRAKAVDYQRRRYGLFYIQG